MKCNYPDCFNCELPDCVMENNDIQKMKRKECYQNNNENEKQQAKRRSYPKCCDCRYCKALLGQDDTVVHYCSKSKRLLNRNIKISPRWCIKRMGLCLSEKEQRFQELDKKIISNIKNRKIEENKRKREIDMKIRRRKAVENGMCSHCFTHKALPGRTRCAKCLEYDALKHRERRQAE